MLDNRCCGSSEAGLFRLWTRDWMVVPPHFIFFKSRSHCQRLKSAWPLAHPLLSHGGFYLAISSSCGGLPGRLNGAMFPVSQIFKWKPTMKVRPLRAAARCSGLPPVAHRHVLGLCSWSQMHQRNEDPRRGGLDGWGRGNRDSICKFNTPHQG